MSSHPVIRVKSVRRDGRRLLWLYVEVDGRRRASWLWEIHPRRRLLDVAWLEGGEWPKGRVRSVSARQLEERR